MPPIYTNTRARPKGLLGPELAAEGQDEVPCQRGWRKDPEPLEVWKQMGCTGGMDIHQGSAMEQLTILEASASKVCSEHLVKG